MTEQEIAQLQVELATYKAGYEAQRKILASIFPERFNGYFICGASTELDTMGLPDIIQVCPQYGLDGFATYKKQGEYSAPGW